MGVSCSLCAACVVDSGRVVYEYVCEQNFYQEHALLCTALLEHYGNNLVKLLVTVAIILCTTIMFTTAEGVLEFFNPRHLPCEDFKFFTHGGMVFLMSTSIAFALAYLSTFVLYLFGFHKRWNLPSKKSFYRYALFLAIVNTVQAIGSFLWYTGESHARSGNAGICLTLITNIIYVTTFAPMVYWIFLSNYFRMNDALKEAEIEKSQINIAAGDRNSSFMNKRSISNPLHIGKRSVFADHTSLIVESYGSSSSYGSLNDEESFIRRSKSPDVDYKNT